MQIGRFEIQRDLKNPRVLQNGNLIRINDINQKIIFYNISSSAKTPIKPRTLGRRRARPRIMYTILLMNNINPDIIIFIKEIENIFCH